MSLFTKLLGNWHALEVDASAEAFVEAASRPRGSFKHLSQDGCSASYGNTVLQDEPVLTSCRKDPAPWGTVPSKDIRSRISGAC